MEKVISMLLMVSMIAAPCFAQEVEPEGMFSVEGTYWEGTFTTPTIDTQGKLDFAFSSGTMYMCMCTYSCASMDCLNISTPTPSTYIDIFLLTFFNATVMMSEAEGIIMNGILIPFLGVGWGSGSLWSGVVTLPLSGTFTKTTDTWTPPGE